MNAKEFLDKEKNTYGNLYSELIFVLDDIEDLSEDSTLKERAYYKNIKILKHMKISVNPTIILSIIVGLIFYLEKLLIN